MFIVIPTSQNFQMSFNRQTIWVPTKSEVLSWVPGEILSLVMAGAMAILPHAVFLLPAQFLLATVYIFGYPHGLCVQLGHKDCVYIWLPSWSLCPVRTFHISMWKVKWQDKDQLPENSLVLVIKGSISWITTQVLLYSKRTTIAIS